MAYVERCLTVAASKDARRDAEKSPSPRNLIHEASRSEPDDPPNLHRLSTMQTLEERGVVEIRERFRGAGLHWDIRHPRYNQ